MRKTMLVVLLGLAAALACGGIMAEDMRALPLILMSQAVMLAGLFLGTGSKA